MFVHEELNFPRWGFIVLLLSWGNTSLLIELDMTWRWIFLISSVEELVCTNGYYFGTQLIKHPSKNTEVIELISLVSHLEYMKEM